MSVATDSGPPGPLDRLMHVTVWQDERARERRGGPISLRALARRIENVRADRKEALKWLKLARFGDSPTESGCFRHNDNVETIEGLEADYDGGVIPFDQAVEIAAKGDLACVIYTSPSHTPERPRWRVLAPFSEALDPIQRDHMMGRLNGLFGGIFAAESWVLSQSYYYGAVQGNGTTHRVEVIDGHAVDELEELDEIYRGKPLHTTSKHKDNDPTYSPASRILRGGPLDVAASQKNIATGAEYHRSTLSLIAHFAAHDAKPEEARDRILELYEQVPPDLRDKRWRNRSSLKHLNSIIDWVFDKENRKSFRNLFRQIAEAQRPAIIAEQRAVGSDGKLLLTSAEFLARYKPPAYLIDGIIQRGYLYSLTARTGHGKTAVMLYAVACLALGRDMHGRGVKQGSVLFCAGENADDIRGRWFAIADKMGFDPRAVPVHFIDGVIDLKISADRIVAEGNAIPDLMLVVVDTAQAYFTGDDPNNNAQQVAFARDLRALTTRLATRPALLVNCHPVKNAARDNIIPMGGSSLLNEVDGNLTLWSDGEGQTTLHWQGKFRGPEFVPLTFKMETHHCDAVIDEDGRLMPSVVAGPMGEIEQAMSEAAQESDEITLLRDIRLHKSTPMQKRAARLNWFYPNGQAAKPKVVKLVGKLVAEKLVRKVGSTGKILVLTPDGEQFLDAENEHRS